MTIFGSDVSHYDDADTTLMFNDGIMFQTHKAGGDDNDAELAPWWDYVRDLRPGVLLGAYWVLYPGNPAGRADAFLARLDSQCPSWRAHPFILQVDCEKWNGMDSTVPGLADIKAFCDRLRLRCPELRPIVYAPRWVYGNSLAGLGYPLWASAYVNGEGWYRALYPGDSSSKWGSYSGQVPAILQYSSSATIGGQTTCDVNAFRGTLAELTALVAPGWDTDMPIDNADVTKIWKTDGMVGTPSNATDQEGNPSRTPAESLQNIEYHVRDTKARILAQEKVLSVLLASVNALSQLDTTDEAAIIAGVLAGLSPEAIAAAIPQDIAQQTADLLAARLAS